MFPRLVFVVIAAGLLAAQVIRNAVVLGMAQKRPADAAEVWSAHPLVEVALGMRQIAAAAHASRQVPSAAKAMIYASAMKAPLAPEPFLVRGVEAELEGNDSLAQRAFEAAQWRDPRSLPAAYFLADRYFRSGNVAAGLSEIAALARMSPSGNATVAPYLAAYARNPANWPQLRSLFHANPELADPTLAALAASPATAPAVIALADPHSKAEDVHWLAPLLDTLVSQGAYSKAKAIWQQLTRAPANGFIHDGDFRDRTSPPPFNWALSASTVGLAERQSKSRLHVIFYGREDGILASELLLLPAGSYRMTLKLAGDAGRAHLLNWSIWCDKADVPLSSVTLDGAAARGWSFNVPADCPAQWIKLSGVSSDVPQQVDEVVTSLQLERTRIGA